MQFQNSIERRPIYKIIINTAEITCKHNEEGQLGEFDTQRNLASNLMSFCESMAIQGVLVKLSEELQVIVGCGEPLSPMYRKDTAHRGNRSIVANVLLLATAQSFRSLKLADVRPFILGGSFFLFEIFILLRRGSNKRVTRVFFLC